MPVGMKEKEESIYNNLNICSTIRYRYSNSRSACMCLCVRVYLLSNAQKNLNILLARVKCSDESTRVSPLNSVSLALQSSTDFILSTWNTMLPMPQHILHLLNITKQKYTRKMIQITKSLWTNYGNCLTNFKLLININSLEFFLVKMDTF